MKHFLKLINRNEKQNIIDFLGIFINQHKIIGVAGNQFLNLL